MNNKQKRTIAARGLTASSRGSYIEVPDKGISGLVQGVTWYDKSVVLTMTVSIDLDELESVEIYDL